MLVYKFSIISLFRLYPIQNYISSTVKHYIASLDAFREILPSIKDSRSQKLVHDQLLYFETRLEDCQCQLWKDFLPDLPKSKINNKNDESMQNTSVDDLKVRLAALKTGKGSMRPRNDEELFARL